MSAAPTTTAGSRWLTRSVAQALRQIAIVVIGCAIAGALAGGFGSRLVMRLSALAAPEVRGVVTENGNVIGDITFSGTIGLALFAGVGSTIVGAGAYTVFGPWLPRSTLPRGLVFGCFLLVLIGTSVIDPGNADFVILGDRGLNVAMFSALFIAFGLVASGAVAFLERRVPPAIELSSRAWALVVLCALPVVPGIAAVALGFVPWRGLALLSAWTAMVASRALARRWSRSAARSLRLAATVVLVLVLVLACADYIDDVATIL